MTPPCPRAVRTCLRLAAGQPVTLAGVRLYTGEDEDILGEWPEVTVCCDQPLQTSPCPWCSRESPPCWPCTRGTAASDRRYAPGQGWTLLTRCYVQTTVTTIEEARLNAKHEDHVHNMESVLLDSPIQLQR